MRKNLLFSFINVYKFFIFFFLNENKDILIFQCGSVLQLLCFFLKKKITWKSVFNRIKIYTHINNCIYTYLSLKTSSRMAMSAKIFTVTNIWVKDHYKRLIWPTVHSSILFSVNFYGTSETRKFLSSYLVME